MATTPVNNNLSESFFSENYPNIAGNSINSGDMVYTDIATGDLKALDSDAHAFYLRGVSNDTYPVNAYPSEPTPKLGMNVTRIGRRKLFTTNGETLVMDQKVYVGANAQTITNVAGTNLVGYVSALGDNSQETVTCTGAPQTVAVDIRARYPAL